jgi:hypothetical protein
MQVLFGNRSHGTVLRRGTSMLQFVKWYRGKYFGMCPFPLSTEIVDEFVQSLVSENKPASNIRGFVEGLNFCKYVVGMDVCGEQTDISLCKGEATHREAGFNAEREGASKSPDCSGGRVFGDVPL